MTCVCSLAGHDLLSLVYAYLTELLVAFAADEFIGADVKITRLDLERFEITAAWYACARVGGRCLIGARG